MTNYKWNYQNELVEKGKLRVSINGRQFKLKWKLFISELARMNLKERQFNSKLICVLEIKRKTKCEPIDSTNVYHMQNSIKETLDIWW